MSFYDYTPKLRSSEKLSSDFSSLLLSEEFSDLTIQTSTGDIRVHKSILSARSPVFNTMLKSPMIENAESRIEIPDFSVEIVREMLNFIYSGTISFMYGNNGTGKIETVFELYKISHKYQLEELRSHCVNLLHFKLDSSNALEIFMFANLYDDKPIKAEACRKIKKSLKGFVKTEEFNNLKLSQPQIFADILSTMSEI